MFRALKGYGRLIAGIAWDTKGMEFARVLKIMELDISDNRLSIGKKAISIISTLLPAQG